VRPDDVVFSEHGSLRLPVVGRAFRGVQYLYELELPDGQRVPCLTPSHVDFPVGSELPVEFKLQHVVVF
jgi:iron(III) transport system ATP-binding protein